MRRATSNGVRTQPMAAEHYTINVERTFTAEEMARIDMGVIPEEMEDKWFIYFDDDRLYFQRSWTGLCVYIAHLQKLDAGAMLRTIDVNPEFNKSTPFDPRHEVRMVFFLIDLLLLGKDVSFPGHGVSAEQDALDAWSSVGRAYFKE